MVKPPKKDETIGKGASLHLSAPWAREVERFSRGNVAVQEGSFLSPADLKNFVDTRTGLHQSYIRETERTRRFAMALAAFLLALACLIPVIAPAGRETLSYWIGGALFVFAAGSMGYSRINWSSEKRQFSVTKDEPDA